MDFSHVYELHKYFSCHSYPVPLSTILAEFNYTKNTFNRIRNYMIDYLGAPIQNKRGQGYFYDLAEQEVFELPGIWFDSKEMMALLLLEQVSGSMQPAVIQNMLAPVEMRLEKMLTDAGIDLSNWQHRLKVISHWQRTCEPAYFVNITQALLTRKQIDIRHWSWKTNETTQRIISPQRLVYYRDNWYLDAWCHLKNAIRTFSLDAITAVNNLDLTALDINHAKLNREVGAGYGIFAGAVNDIAKLSFSGQMAKRVSRENWHPEQYGVWEDDIYMLSIPYSQPEELIRDILRYGSDVEVLAPRSLKLAIMQELENTIKKYC